MTDARLTVEEMDTLYEASLHPYECDCDLCVWFWSMMPPEAEPTTGRQCEDCGAISGFSNHFPECPNAEPP